MKRGRVGPDMAAMTEGERARYEARVRAEAIEWARERGITYEPPPDTEAAILSDERFSDQQRRFLLEMVALLVAADADE